MAKATRDVILRTLRTQGRCTIKELADAASISPVSVRHHLANLQVHGLVDVEEERHGVGRPHHVYSLTEQALELFPTRYLRLTNRLIDQMKEALPEGKVLELFAAVASSMAEACAQQLRGLPLEERTQHLAELLFNEGFETDLQQHGDSLVIRVLSCPYLRVGMEHPEVCRVDQEFIATALSLPVERVTCLLEGDVHCSYEVDIKNARLESERHE